MSSSYDQALVSTDPEFVKLTRASFKGKLTRGLATLRSVLQRTGVGDDSPFDHDNIDLAEVQQLVSDLRQNKELFDELHMRYEISRKHEADETAESALEKKDNEYMVEMDDNVRGGIKMYNSFIIENKAKQQYKANQDKLAFDIGKYPEKLRIFKQQKLDYEGVHQEANNVVESSDIGERRTAEFQKSCLRQKFDEMDKMGSELLSLVPHITAGVDAARRS